MCGAVAVAVAVAAAVATNRVFVVAFFFIYSPNECLFIFDGSAVHKIHV